jgi:hypothetical protein
VNNKTYADLFFLFQRNLFKLQIGKSENIYHKVSTILDSVERISAVDIVLLETF